MLIKIRNGILQYSKVLGHTLLPQNETNACCSEGQYILKGINHGSNEHANKVTEKLKIPCFPGFTSWFQRVRSQ